MTNNDSLKKCNDFSEKEKFCRAAWQSLSVNGSRYLAALLEYFPSAEAAWEASDNDIIWAGIMPEATARRLAAARQDRRDYPCQLWEECQKKKISLVMLGEPEYPNLLAEIYNPPQVLFYRGQLRGDSHRISIVGSRKVTPYGRSVAELLGRELGEASVSVVSGGAAGVDTEAHRGAMVKGITEVVLGCGVDVAYPRSNQQLYWNVAQEGAIISEYPPGTRPYGMFFPLRNRIISGMSRGTVVVEAAERSGSLITAEYALNENRDLFAVPGSVFAQASTGCNKLIQQGAHLITCAADILAEYSDWQQEKQKGVKGDHKNIMDQEMKDVLKCLSPDNPLNIDEIIYRLQEGSRADKLSYLLLQMEMKGLVRKYAGGYISVP